MNVMNLSKHAVNGEKGTRLAIIMVPHFNSRPDGRL